MATAGHPLVVEAANAIEADLDRVRMPDGSPAPDPSWRSALVALRKAGRTDGGAP
jgi:hypothetical protein